MMSIDEAMEVLSANGPKFPAGEFFSLEPRSEEFLRVQALKDEAHAVIDAKINAEREAEQAEREAGTLGSWW